MAKEKRYYLIRQWCPARGQTQDNPNCYFCGGWVTAPPLTWVKAINCYTSKARAERVAAKHYTLNYHTDVIEIPKEIVKETW